MRTAFSDVCKSKKHTNAVDTQSDARLNTIELSQGNPCGRGKCALTVGRKSHFQALVYEKINVGINSIEPAIRNRVFRKTCERKKKFDGLL